VKSHTWHQSLITTRYKGPNDKRVKTIALHDELHKNRICIDRRWNIKNKQIITGQIKMDWSHQAIEYTGWMDTCSGVIQKVTNA